MTDDLILLDDVCKRYFNVIPRVARRKVLRGTLPVPAFKLSGTRKGPYYVRKKDISAWVAKRAADATKLRLQVQPA